jgi:hypothetical protein
MPSWRSACLVKHRDNFTLTFSQVVSRRFEIDRQTAVREVLKRVLIVNSVDIPRSHEELRCYLWKMRMEMEMSPRLAFMLNIVQNDCKMELSAW